MKNLFMKVCAFFFKRLASLNNRYDKKDDKKRFLTVLWFIYGPIMTLQLVSVVTENVWYSVSSMLWILLLSYIRFWWLHKDLRDWLPIKKGVQVQ